jgi:hypothetical protein
MRGRTCEDMFGPGKTVNEYRGELGTVFQRPGENILDYIDRVRNLRLAIIDGERCQYGSISQDVQDTIDWDTREAFVKGLPNEVYLRVKLSEYQSLEDAYRQAVKATRELKRVYDRMRYQRPTSSSNNNRNNVRPPNNNYIENNRNNARPSNNNYTGNNRNNVNPPNNNYTGNNHDDRRCVPPSQNRPNTPSRQLIVCKYCKKPGHFVRDCYKFKARVDAGIIVPYASGQSGNQPTPSRTGGRTSKEQRYESPKSSGGNEKAETFASKRNADNDPPPPTPIPQPTNNTPKPSRNHAQEQSGNRENQQRKGKTIHEKTNKNHQESDSDSDNDLSGLFQ